MSNPEVSIVIDLEGPARPNAQQLREELLAKLRDPATSTYEFSHGNARFRPIAGSLVKVTNSISTDSDNWRAFAGLKISFVRISDNGSDHFPAAGIYHAGKAGKREIGGTTAMVRWSIDHEYPLQEGTIESLVRGSRSDYYTESLRLVVPVVYSRKWSLTLTAPSIKRALRAYEMLRGGDWPVTTPFVDRLDDTQKLRLLQQTIDTED